MTYGCYNRPPLRDHHWVQNGWRFMGRNDARAPVIEPIADLMTKTCQYQKDDKYNDPGCMGCCHKMSLRGHAPDLLQGAQPADS